MSKLKKEYNYHYTYRITNVIEKKYYYGVHSCNCLPKEDIGVKYFSSSNQEFIDNQKNKPENYKYKVIKIFSSRKEAIEHEVFLHKKFNVKLHNSFYNRVNQTSTKFDTTGKGTFIDENGKIISISIEEAKIRNLKGSTTGKPAWNKGVKMTESYNKILKEKIKNNRISFKGENNPNYGKKTPEDVKEKIRLGNLGKKLAEETKQKMCESRIGENHWNYGKFHSKETIQKMRKPRSEEGKANMRKPQKIIKCPHCLKEGGSSNMMRYHFDNCKITYIKKSNRN